MSATFERALAEPELPPLLRLPDELLTQIFEHLLYWEHDWEHDKALTSLTVVCQRVRTLAIPLRWKIVKINETVRTLEADVAGLAVHNVHVESLCVRLSTSQFPAELVDKLASHFHRFSHLTKLSLNFMFGDNGSLASAARLVPSVQAIGPQLVDLIINLSRTQSDALTDAITDLLKFTPNLVQLSFGINLYRPEGRRAPQISTLPSLRRLCISDMRFLSSLARIPALQRLTIGEVSSMDLPFMCTCFGSSLESLEVVWTWAEPPQGLQVAFPKLSEICFDSNSGRPRPPPGLLSDILGPTTPLETLKLTALDDRTISDLQRFVDRQPRPTLKRITLAKEKYEEILDIFPSLLRHSPISAEENEVRMQDELENVVRPRFRRFCAWAEQHEIKVDALWHDKEDNGCVVA